MDSKGHYKFDNLWLYYNNNKFRLKMFPYDVFKLNQYSCADICFLH